MKYLIVIKVALLLIATSFMHCSENSSEEVPEGRSILSFQFESTVPVSVGVIDEGQGIINITVPFGTDLTSLAPTIEISEGATVSPESGVNQDFSDFVVYTVTAGNGAKRVYTVITEIGPSNIADLQNIVFPGLFLSGRFTSGQQDITFDVPFGSDLSSVEVDYVTTEDAASVEPAPGTLVDFTQPVEITVTAPDGVATKTYTVSFNVGEEETGIRGVWLTNVDSNVLLSQEGILEAVDKCSSLNINTIFVVTYNKAMTTYPSDVMENLTGVRIDPRYEGRDPLRELIDAAHAKNIKVLAWFEYGFAANIGSPGPILNARPEWASINSDGETVVKNGFYWMNSLHPDVQEFMTSLVLEVVQNYPDIDGVQGDDRLPAMPTEGGYDTYTVEKYKAEHGGEEPPLDYQEGNWTQWRADILTDYAGQLYDTIKLTNPNCIVAMSPSPMTFGLREYLQDYPAWVKNGYCDIVSPQLYRRDNQGISIYRGLLTDQLARVGSENTDTFYPGILSFLAGYSPDEEFMANMIRENRKNGVSGEVHFFYNTLLVREEVFKVMYPAPAIFPEL